MSSKTQNLFNLISPAEAAKVMSFALPVFGTLFLTGHFGWLTAINAALGIIGVLAVFLAPANPWVKTLVAAGIAVLQALAVYVTDATGFSGVTRDDWWAVIGAGFGAVGVLVVPNKVLPQANEGDGHSTTIVNVTGPAPEAPKSEIEDQYMH